MRALLACLWLGAMMVLAVAIAVWGAIEAFRVHPWVMTGVVLFLVVSWWAVCILAPPPPER